MVKVEVSPVQVVKPVQPDRVTQKAVSPYFIAGSLGLLALSLTGSMFIDAELNGLYRFIFCYLTLPVVMLSYAVMWFGMTRWRRNVSWLKAAMAPGAVALAILFTCGGLVNYANALLSTGEKVQFSGPITKLSSSSGRGGRGYYLALSDTATGQGRKFRITHQEYLNLKVGYAYIRTMKQGGLGYAFQWRH